MPTWKAFEENTVTHSVAHHLTAIADLMTEYGYARVSDVARKLEITRGSASITLKGLKKRGLVTEDDRRFLGLSSEGRRIALSIQARRVVMKRLFCDVLGISPDQAEIDACKVEHLVSPETAERITRFLRFLGAGGRTVSKFLEAYEAFDETCDHSPDACPCCDIDCLTAQAIDLPDTRNSSTKGA